MQFDGMDLQFANGIWRGTVASGLGKIEVMFDGTLEQPDREELATYRQFATSLTANIARLKKQIPWSFMYRPVRIAVNSQCRIGVQFRHRITRHEVSVLHV